MNRSFCGDCMTVLHGFSDNYFDLAICDPPYGIDKAFRPQSRLAKYGDPGIANDEKPTRRIIDEIFRVSKNQIIFGWNHISDLLPPTKEFVVWYKHQPVESYSDAELAWTSFKKTAKVFDYPFFGSVGAEGLRIHPTQKPIALYKWIIDTYCKEGDVILDPYLGSGSSRIAAYDKNMDFVGIEKDRSFYEAEEQRFENHISQLSLFDVGGVQ